MPTTQFSTVNPLFILKNANHCFFSHSDLPTVGGIHNAPFPLERAGSCFGTFNFVCFAFDLQTKNSKRFGNLRNRPALAFVVVFCARRGGRCEFTFSFTKEFGCYCLRFADFHALRNYCRRLVHQQNYSNTKQNFSQSTAEKIMNQNSLELWIYLRAQPLFWLTITLIVYVITNELWLYARRRPFLHPMLWSTVILALMVYFARVPYENYFSGAQFIHFLLGPATVVLAVPLIRQWETLKRYWLAIGVGLFAGSVTAILVALLICQLFGAEISISLSLLPKSATTPIAMAISEMQGGIPALTATIVILTGIVGAMLGPWVLNKIGITNDIAIGVGIGTASHGCGTAQAFTISHSAGAFSGLAMGLNGLLTALLVPLLVSWFLK